MPLFVQIENTLAKEISIYRDSFTFLRLLPGINLIPNKTYALMKSHKKLLQYLEMGTLVLVNRDLSEIQTDKETGISSLKGGDDGDIPVVSSDGKAVSSVSAGFRKFEISDLVKAQFTKSLAAVFLKAQPPTGWRDAQAVIDGLGLADKPNDVARVNKLFEQD